MHGWGATAEATYSKIGTATFLRTETRAFGGSSCFWGAARGGTGTGKVVRAFNKVLRFFSRGKLAYGSSGMSNGCCGIACRFTHQANFPAYRGAIFLSLPCPPVGSIAALLLFPSSPSANSSSHSFPFAPSSLGWTRAFLPVPEFGCTVNMVIAFRRKARASRPFLRAFRINVQGYFLPETNIWILVKCRNLGRS